MGEILKDHHHLATKFIKLICGPAQVVTRGIRTQPESEIDRRKNEGSMRFVDQRDNKLASMTQVEEVLWVWPRKMMAEEGVRT